MLAFSDRPTAAHTQMLASTVRSCAAVQTGAATWS